MQRDNQSKMDMYKKLVSQGILLASKTKLRTKSSKLLHSLSHALYDTITENENLRSKLKGQ